MKSFKADYVFPVYADPIKNGIVTVDDTGKIISVSDHASSDSKIPAPEYVSGIICPGFINTHCHLELSHMLGKVSPKTGLVEFIKNILKQRGADNAEIIAAAEKAD